MASIGRGWEAMVVILLWSPACGVLRRTSRVGIVRPLMLVLMLVLGVKGRRSRAQYAAVRVITVWWRRALGVWRLRSVSVTWFRIDRAAAAALVRISLSFDC